jgi:hypothetical protein
VHVQTLDLAPIRAALRAALVPALARDVAELASVARADPEQLHAVLPRVVVVPVRSLVSGPAGLGHGRMLTEEVGVICQLAYSRADDEAGDVLRAMREAALSALEGHPPAAGWSPLRWQGGRVLAARSGHYSWIDLIQTQLPVHELRGEALS